jgi:putative Mg2+ transporter-C (MgtC) family protein
MDLELLGQMVLALLAAAFLGGLIGLEREAKGRWAGLRTHMMVSLGSCLFVLVGVASTRASPAELSRVIQGIATGVGFIGAGTIIKLTDQVEVKGLTTASSIWLAAAIGTTCGMELYELAFAVTVLAMVILVVLRPIERWIADQPHKEMSGETTSPEGTEPKRRRRRGQSSEDD